MAQIRGISAAIECLGGGCSLNYSDFRPVWWGRRGAQSSGKQNLILAVSNGSVSVQQVKKGAGETHGCQGDGLWRSTSPAAAALGVGKGRRGWQEAGRLSCCPKVHLFLALKVECWAGGAPAVPQGVPVPVPQVSGAIGVLWRAPKAPSRLVFMLQVRYIHLE